MGAQRKRRVLRGATYRALLIAVLVGAVGAMAACDGTAGRTSVSGALIGAGGPFDTPSVGLAGEVRFSSTGRSFSVKTDGDGRFVAQLPPGEYRVDGAANVFGGAPGCNGIEPLTVHTTEVRDVLVICGIR